MKPNLNKALALAQAEMPMAQATGYNPHFKSEFATLTDLVSASRPSLTKYGLSVKQYAKSVGDDLLFITVLAHESGEEEVSEVKLHLDKPSDMQAFGRAVSYMARYMYKTMVGVMTNDSEDDDGNASAATSQSNNWISEKQVALLKMKCRNKPGAEEKILERYGIDSLEKLPWKEMNKIVEWLDKPKE